MNKNKVKKIMVTGGGGFLGSTICSLLIKKGYEVISFSRKTYSSLKKKGVHCIAGDIRSQKEVCSALTNCDTVIHTAAKAGVWGKKDDYHEINYEGTKNLITNMKEKNIKSLLLRSIFLQHY